MTSGNVLRFQSWNNDHDFYLPTQIENGTWHQITVTYDGAGNLTAYLDAIPVGTATISTLSTSLGTSGLFVGEDGGGNCRIGGKVDELAIYPTALTQAQVSSHFNASGIARPAAPTSVTASPGANQATVSWTAATSPAPYAVSAYVVTAIAGGRSLNSVATSGTTTSVTMSGLKGSTAYTFVVSALNNFGLGPASAASASVSPTGTTTTYASTVLADLPALYYRFGDAGGSIAADSSGNGQYLTISGSNVTQGATGVLLNDSDGSLSLRTGIAQNGAPVGLPSGNAARTVETWLKTSSADYPTGCLLAYGRGADRSFFALQVTSGNILRVQTWNNDHDFYLPTPIENGTWHQITVTYGGSGNLIAYLDAIQVGSATIASPLSTTLDNNGLYMGQDSGGNCHLGGNVDETAIYASALTQSQVTNHFNASGAVRPGAPTGVSAVAGSNQATISWAAATSPANYPVTGYVVSAFTGTQSVNSIATSGSTTSVTLSGLQSGTAYTFTAAAFNNFGQGPASAPSSSTTPSGAPSTYASTVLADHPAVYYRFGEPNGTMAADSSGNGQHAYYYGTSYSPGTASALPNDPDPSVTFTSCGNCAVAQDLTPTGLPLGNSARTVEAWFKSPGPAGYVVSYGKPSGWGSDGTFWVKLTSSDQVQLLLWNDDKTFATPYSIWDNSWHQLTLTYDGSGHLTLYLDGQSIGSATVSTLATVLDNNGIYVGRDGGGNGEFGGSLDEVAVYPTALTATQVLAHFSASGNARPIAPTGVLAFASNGKATVSWIPSTTSPVASYLVTAYSGSTAQQTVAVDGTTTSVTMSGLAGSTAYTFKVAGQNSFGLGAYSAASPTVTESGPATGYAAKILGDNPSAYFRLSEPSGSTMADSSGHGVNGTYSGAYTLKSAGALGNDPDPAVSFSGGYAQLLNTSTVPTGSSARSVEGWFQTTNYGPNALVGYGTTNGYRTRFELRLQDPTHIQIFGSNENLNFTTAASMADGNWHQVVVTYDGATSSSAYLDGALVGTATWSAALGTSIPIGDTLTLAQGYFAGYAGLLDEVAIYPAALSATQIANHYSSAGRTALSPPTGVTAVAGVNQATVSWTPPTGASASTTYTVTPYSSGTALAPITVTGATSTDVGGLSGGMDHSFVVSATNSMGAGGSSTASSAVTVTAPAQGPGGAGAGLGDYLNIRPSYKVAYPQADFGFVTAGQLGAMSQWTVEGYLWGAESNATTYSNAAWGILSPGPSTGSPIAGINFALSCGGSGCPQSYFTYPGGQYALGPGNFPAAMGSTPGHFAIDYDGTTVRGFINGVLVFSQASPTAATTSGPAGLYDNSALTSMNMDEFRVSNTARYTANFTPPTTNFATDANTKVLWHFDNFGMKRIAAVTIGNSNAGPFTTANVFKDYSGNGNHAGMVWASHSYVSIGPVTEYAYELAPGVASDELDGNGSYWMCPCMLSHTDWPVNTATGEFWHTFSDLVIPGRGMPLALGRTYSSRQAATNGPFGYGWTDTYAMSLTVDGSGNVTVLEGNNSVIVFKNLAGVLTAAPHVLASMVKNGDGTYTLTQKDKSTYKFDISGRLTAETDSNSNTTTLAYDGITRLLSSVTDPASRQLTFNWTASHITTVTDVSGSRSLTYSYDGSGNLTQVTDIGSGVTKFTYDANHLLLTLKDPKCSADVTCTGVVNVYDVNGRVASQTDAMNRKTQFSYAVDADSTTTTITDPRGDVMTEEYQNNVLLAVTKGVGTALQATWTYGYDTSTLGQTSVTDPNGHVTSSTRDAQANLLSSTDGLGRSVSATYNSFNKPLTSVDAAGVTTTNTYDTHGNLTQSSTPLVGSGTSRVVAYAYTDATHTGDVTQMTDPDGKVWLYTYDSYGNRLSATDPLGNKSTYTYDSVGRLLTSVAPKGNVTGGVPANFRTTYTPNAYGDRTSVSDPLSHSTSYLYDANRNVTQVTDANGHITTYSFDFDNEVTQEVDASGTASARTLGTGYDANGNVTTQTDALSHVTTYAYDVLNRRTSTTDALNRVTTYTYDLAGQLSGALDAMGQSTAYTYDSAGQLSSVRYATGTPEVTYAYNLNGQRTSMTDGTGSTSYSYDSLHRLTQSTNGASAQVRYGYNLRGGITSLVYPGGVNTVSRTYDDAGRLRTVSDWLSHTTTYGYDENSNLTTTTYPNGVVATNAFDNANRLNSISDVKGGTTLLSLSYGRDSLGLLTSNAGQTEGYDPLNRLTTSQQTYVYDSANRITQKSITGGNSTALAYDTGDQLGSATVTNGGTTISTTTYLYDKNGNRFAAQAPALTRYGFDQANRMFAYGTAATYAYNGDGTRMSKTVSGTTTAQTWDVAEGLPLVIADGTTSYVTGAGGSPLEMISGTTVNYFHADQLGSTRVLTDSTGASAGTYVFDEYGNVASHTGTATTLQFNGQYVDAESGLIYLRARYYESTTPEFISKDPAIVTTRQAYVYAASSPLNATDPSGVCPWCIGAIAGALIGAGADAAWQYERNGGTVDHFSWGELGIATVGGAVVGGTLGLAAGWIAEGGVGAAAVHGPLGGIYTSKVLAQMSQDDYHGFPILVDSMVNEADAAVGRGGDGEVYTFVNMPGAINGCNGTYQWVINQAGEITHRFFARGG